MVHAVSIVSTDIHPLSSVSVISCQCCMVGDILKLGLSDINHVAMYEFLSLFSIYSGYPLFSRPSDSTTLSSQAHCCHDMTTEVFPDYYVSGSESVFTLELSTSFPLHLAALGVTVHPDTRQRCRHAA